MNTVQLTVDQALAKAEAAIREGNLKAAAQFYRAILAYDQDHPEAREGLTRVERERALVRAQEERSLQERLNELIRLYQAGRMAETEQAAKEMIQGGPDSFMAFNILGAAIQAQGRLNEALDAFDRMVALNPNFAEGHNNRATLLREMGRLEEAVKGYDRAVDLKPDFVEAYNNRGVTLNALKRHGEAVSSYDYAIRLNPNHVGAYNNRALALMDAGRYELAVKDCIRAVRLNPNIAELHNVHGLVLGSLGRFKEAVECFDRAIALRSDFVSAIVNRAKNLNDLEAFPQALADSDRAIELNPDLFKAHYNRGLSLYGLGRQDQAILAYNRAIELNPDFADAFANRGMAYYDLDRMDSALSSFDAAIALNPDLIEAYNNRANVLSDMGKKELAKADVERVLSINPRYAPAHRGLSRLKTYRPGDAHIHQMEALLADAHTVKPDRAHLHFALFKAYDDSGEPDTAFDHLVRGNRLRKQLLLYDYGADIHLFGLIREVFESSWQAHEPRPEIEKDQDAVHPIFILGMPRSGTSLVEQILSSHSKVLGAGELEAMSMLISPLLTARNQAGIPEGQMALSCEEARTLRKNYLGFLDTLGYRGPFVTDKMPLNFRFVGFIKAAFPDAKIIHMNRDPMAVCWSNFKQYFTSKGNGYAYDFEDLSGFYRLYTDLMAFWRERFSDIYDLDYERLTENQEAETRKLLAYCGLEWEEDCLEFHKNKRAMKTASFAQVREKMYTGSSQAWRKYESHLKPLYEALEKKLGSRFRTIREDTTPAPDSSLPPLPYGRQSIGSSEIDAVARVLEGAFLTTGPKVEEFEAALCKLTGARHAVACVNGTAALHLACMALGVGKGDLGLTSPISFLASANGIEYCGGEADFVDIDSSSLCLSPDDLEKYCKTHGVPKVVIPVDFAGIPADLPAIRALADAYGFSIIEDAAHALGSSYRVQGQTYACGSCAHSDLAVFSFHPVKTVTTGEGGAVMTNDDALAARLRCLRNHGMEKNEALLAEEGGWAYEMNALGFNFRITDIQCALGCAQLEKLDEFKKRRLQIVSRYNEAFRERSDLVLPPEPLSSRACPHIYPIRFSGGSKVRRRMYDALRRDNIFCQIHYIPIHLQPYYRRRYGYEPGKCEVAETYYSQCMSLPLFPSMTDQDVDRVISRLLLHLEGIGI